MHSQTQFMLQRAIQSFQDGDFDAAVAILKELLQKDINSADLFFELAIAYAKANKLFEAKAVFCCLQPYKADDVRIPYNLGLIYSLQGMHQLAVEAYDRALTIKPYDAEVLINKASACNDLKNYDLALDIIEKAIAINPQIPEAWINKAIALENLDFYDDALDAYLKAISLNPTLDWVYGYFLLTKMKICSWTDFPKYKKYIAEKVMLCERIVRPFELLGLIDDALLQKMASETYLQTTFPQNPILGSISKHRSTQKIRVAYFSADFRNHPVGFLIAELIELHERSQFELYAFSLVKADDEMQGRFEQAFDKFIDVQNKTDIEIAQLARELEIDIAVDLTGLTRDSRTGIFAYRAAPIQVNYLGYPGTMGADYMDYIVADRTLIPHQSEKFYSEKIVFLPNSYQVNDRKRIISDRRFTRRELGLPKSGFVFCCFNNNFKILPETFNSWMRILKSVEGSVLWLLVDNPSAKSNLIIEAKKQGIDSERIIFAERMPLSEHLSRQKNADLFLDTLPYNAHTTSSDALWSGLPVLSLIGNSFVSRVAASLLNAIGLPELIVKGPKEYEELAIELATNPERLENIKLKLINQRLTAPLFDTPLFTKNLEAAYIKIYDRYRLDLPPDHIYV